MHFEILESSYVRTVIIMITCDDIHIIQLRVAYGHFAPDPLGLL